MALHCEECLANVDPDGKDYFYVFDAAADDDVTLCSSHCLAQYAQRVIEAEEDASERDEDE